MKYLLVIWLMLATIPMQAQKKKAKISAVNTEKTAGETLFATMLSGTAKVMFIDSVVVDKQNFMQYIPLSNDAGRVQSTGMQAAYYNGLNNHRIEALGDTVKGMSLYAAYFLGKAWSKPKQLTELNTEVNNPTYPFLLSDGTTLFFAAQGEKSIGGYDIFMTIKNTAEDVYYKPENYGLPFNSIYNDYFLAIDDINNIGWLVSDRYQPENKVCIYTFVPTNPRLNFSSDNLSDEQLTQYAKITSIKDTWKFGDRKAALSRIAAMKRQNQQNSSEPTVFFVVNNNVVYRNINDFKSEQSKEQFLQLTKFKKQLLQNEATLQNMRNEYHRGSTPQKKSLKEALETAEKTLQQQRKDVDLFEKNIRNQENKLLN